MTVEKAIARLKILTDYEYDEDLEALEMAINTLEQERSVIEELEKIKAEIKPLRYGSDTYKYAIDDVLEILDNYISELKGEDNEI